MKKEKDYSRDIAEIRSMMERTSKFLSLAGWAGIMAGMYALLGAVAAYGFFRFQPEEIFYTSQEMPNGEGGLIQLILLATVILLLSVSTAIYLSSRKAARRGEQIWNATTKRLVFNMLTPLVAGGVLVLILIAKGALGLLPSVTLIFYGLALYNAGQYTFKELRIFGLIQLALGLLSAYFVEYGLLLWSLGFGVLHIIYGIYVHNKYE